ncbi:UNVERIFIED_CONTAM: Arabinosyltransferase RRA2 [Sesamum radiatum]|uniref:Arabinosyltransferase RRA2 n=1 Tax=Sesamum radiatum TaxID=300843 RepID=A0AAW2QEX5_SESRA
MAVGRRDKSSQLSNRGSRIAAAIGIGVIVGCIFAFLFPHGFFSSNPAAQIQPLSNSNLQAGPFGCVKGVRTNPTVTPDESINPRLAKILAEVAVGKELIVALANSNSNDVPFYQRDPDETIDSVGKTGISDVESMSDGHNNMTAYGYNDVFDEPAMGWARYAAHTMRIWAYYPSIELLDRIADRLARQANAWTKLFSMRALLPFSSWLCGASCFKENYGFLSLYEQQGTLQDRQKRC